jgi:hypothetical protein
MNAPILAQIHIDATAAIQGFMPPKNNLAIIVMDRHIMEPTERSMPPEINRIVIPMTTIPSIEREPSTTLMFAHFAK